MLRILKTRAGPGVAGSGLRWSLVLSVLFALQPAFGADTPAVSGDAAGLPVIREIVFTGNEVTRREILAQEMLVHVGGPADPVLIEQSRQAIMNLGLFVSVFAITDARDDGVVLRIHVKEKYYFLPVPKLNRNEQNQISLGAEIAIDNLGGFNQQFKLRYESEDAPGLSNREITSYYAGYYYPRLLGTTFNLRSEIGKDVSPAEEVSGTSLLSLYEKEAWTATLMLTRWLNPVGPSHGWLAGGGLVWRRNIYDYVSGPSTPTFQDSMAVGIAASIQFVDVADYLYSRSGIDYGYTGEYGSKTLGSDTHYNRHEFYYRRYFLFDAAKHENVDVQAKLGLSSGDMFLGDLYAYAIGGNKSLRAYDSGSITGNAYALLNVQYLRSLFGYNPLRGSVFIDAGNAYPNNLELHLGKLHWDVGLGLRLRLKAFVKVDLRLDVAYAPETNQTRAFLGTREMF